MTDNFLPDFHPAITQGREKTVQCLIRDKAIRAKPEECVRQRVLHWLLKNKGWKKDNLRLEKSYDWVSDANRTRIRPDIKLLVDGKVLVVVECKRHDIPLGEHVDKQAIEYAIKANAPWIWTTNGESHAFLKKERGSKWNPIDSLEPLDISSDAPVSKLEFPRIVDDRKIMDRYWTSFGDPQFLNGDKNYDQRFVLAAHRMLFDIPKKLPYSHGGVHLLEDRGSAWHRFGNASGGSYHTRYADFIAATQGRVEALSVAVNTWDSGGLRLCVGVRKPNRTHHALQLNVDNCERDEKEKGWHIFHDVRMSNVANNVVIEAVREAQAGGWIEAYDNKDWIYLGVLKDAEYVTWRNSKKLLANLIHYAVIRTNLREAQSVR